MKKLCSIMLALLLVLSLGILPGFAAGTVIDQNAEQTGSTNVTYSVAGPSYTVTIPANATLNQAFDVKAESVQNLANNQYLTVSITDWTKDADTGFVLKNEQAAIPCTVKKGADSDQAYALGDTVLKIDSTQSGGTAPMYITQTDPNGIYAPGTYEGTMTFHIALETLGREQTPFVVTNAEELIAAFKCTNNETNHIRLDSDLVDDTLMISSNIIFDAQYKPMVLDLNGKTLKLENASCLTLRGSATIKNGYIKSTKPVEASNASIILEGLNIENTHGSAFKVSGGTATINDCNIKAGDKSPYEYCGMEIASGTVVATNVTITGEEGAYTVEEGASLTLDGNPQTGIYGQQTYKSPGRP